MYMKKLRWKYVRYVDNTDLIRSFLKPIYLHSNAYCLHHSRECLSERPLHGTKPFFYRLHCNNEHVVTCTNRILIVTANNGKVWSGSHEDRHWIMRSPRWYELKYIYFNERRCGTTVARHDWFTNDVNLVDCVGKL